MELMLGDDVEAMQVDLFGQETSADYAALQGQAMQVDLSSREAHRWYGADARDDVEAMWALQAAALDHSMRPAEAAKQLLFRGGLLLSHCHRTAERLM